jgi:hypothetical protein
MDRILLPVLLAIVFVGNVSSLLTEGQRCSQNNGDPNYACDHTRFLECQRDGVCRCRSTSSSQLFWIPRLDSCAYKVGSACSPDGRQERQISFNQQIGGFGLGGGNYPLCPRNSFCQPQQLTGIGACTCESGYPPSYDYTECSGAWTKLSPALGLLSLLLTATYAKVLA